jgi:fatty-acyl-CoA synthase
MLSYDAGPVDVPLLEETIGSNLDRTVAAHGDRPALVSVHQGIHWTYREFAAEVERLARGLLGVGMRPGDRVGIWAPNQAEWVVTQYATARMGAVLVNINPAYRTSELAYALDRSGCRMLVSAPEFKGSDYVAMVDEVRQGLPLLERVVFLDGPDWDDLIAAAGGVNPSELRSVEEGLHPRDPINIQYTSGTTGFPKGATLSHRNILNNGYYVGEICRYTEADRVCIPVPLYHCFGMVMGNLGATTHGAAMVLPGPAFDPDDVLAAVEQERCTSLYGVPTMFIAELEALQQTGYDVSSLRTGIMAGAPCPIEVMRRVVDELHVPEITICYGMTETSPVSTQTRVEDDLDRRVSTVGRVHPHVEVRIADPDTGVPTERGASGEIQTRGYSVMLGYWEDPERTAEAIDPEGWMRTGDLGTMDEDGYVRVVGRIKDMIIRGGENIYPREIEEFLFTHPDVLDAQVVGVPDPRFGEQVMAWVRRRAGSGLTEEQLREYCRGKIAHFKIPAHVRFVDDYPMTVTGKVQKFVLREMGEKVVSSE